MLAYTGAPLTWIFGLVNVRPDHSTIKMTVKRMSGRSLFPLSSIHALCLIRGRGCRRWCRSIEARIVVFTVCFRRASAVMTECGRLFLSRYLVCRGELDADDFPSSALLLMYPLPPHLNSIDSRSKFRPAAMSTSILTLMHTSPDMSTKDQ